MKRFSAPLLMAFVLAWASGAAITARAADFRMLVIDADPKGASLRERPNGPVIGVIPHGGKTDAEREKREVTVTGQDKDWFSVRLDDESVGWLHGSVLGSCSSATVPWTISERCESESNISLPPNDWRSQRSARRPRGARSLS